MSIANDDQLKLSHEQIGRLQWALSSLRKDMSERNTFGFRLLAEGPLDEMRRIRAEIAEYTGENFLEAEETDLRFRIIGPLVHWRDVPVSVLGAFLKGIRTGVRSLAANSFAAVGANVAKTEIDRASDLSVVDFQPGSLQIGLRLPEYVSHQTDLFETDYRTPVLDAIVDYLAVADWVGSQRPVESLIERFPDASRRRVALRAMKPIIPRDRRTVEAVELSGEPIGLRNVIKLTWSGAPRIQDAYKIAISTSEVSLEGDMREIDLDSRIFTLRNVAGEPRDIKCEFPAGLKGEAHGALGKKVIVIGTRQTRSDGVWQGRVAISELLAAESRPTE